MNLFAAEKEPEEISIELQKGSWRYKKTRRGKSEILLPIRGGSRDSGPRK